MSQNNSGVTKEPTTSVEVAHNMYGLMSEGVGFWISYINEERKWRRRKRVFISLLVLMSVILWLLLYAPMLGLSAAPATRSIGVVPIQGQIGDQYGASARKIVPAIERACASSMTEAVVIRITSPGGSPTDAERIAGAVDACRAGKDGKPGKRVIAVVENVGASAAYLIAIHADEVVATRYSMVGSIGAVMRSVDAEAAAKKFGLQERVYASGDLKAGNSPLTANTPAQDALSQELVDGIAKMFTQEVRDRRGSKLKETPDMFSGRVWLAPEAVELGLIDQAATFEQLKASRFKDLSVHEFRPTQTFQDKIGLRTMVREFGAGIASEFTGTDLQ